MKILLDCDGILADFSSAYLKIIEQLTGFQYKIEDLTNFEYLKALDLECLYKDIQKELYKKKFCRNISVYPEALEGFNKLKSLGEVIIVTSPMLGGPYWLFERSEWLKEHFGIKKNNLIFASRKELVQGDIFIDDKLETVEKWEKENTGLALLFDRPWNKYKNYYNRMNSWKDLINKVDDYKIGMEYYRCNH